MEAGGVGWDAEPHVVCVKVVEQHPRDSLLWFHRVMMVVLGSRVPRLDWSFLGHYVSN